jgi:hypothetical protein
VAKQAALLESYCSAHKICLARWRYRQRLAELEAAYKEFDEAASEVWDKTNDEEDIVGSRRPRPAAKTMKPAHPRAPLVARKSSTW